MDTTEHTFPLFSPFNYMLKICAVQLCKYLSIKKNLRKVVQNHLRLDLEITLQYGESMAWQSMGPQRQLLVMSREISKRRRYLGMS